MKKSFVAITITTMLLVSILPVISVSSDNGITGEITYNPDGGGNVDPVKILAIWETNGESYLDDDLYSPGCQIDPPMRWNQYSTVCVFVAVLDPDDDILYNTQIKVDLSWPDNGIVDRPDLGDGTKAVDNVEPVCGAFWEDYVAAYAIDSGSNSPFICYYNQANDGGDDGYDYVHWQYFESNVKFFVACYDLYYHDPAGWYDAEVTIQGTHVDSQLNYFEYVYCLGAETDFDIVNWGNEHELYEWHAVDGNWDWDFGSEVPPTIKNVGNWDAELGFHFYSGDFNPNDVVFDVRAGDSNSESDYYCQTYCEVNGIDGMVPCNDYWPLPVNNFPWLGTDYYDDVLLKCHKMKLDFYICISQWTNGAGPYNFDIDIFCKDPMWQPALGFPCPNGPPEPEPEADIGIQKTVDNSEPVLNSNVEFTITVTNHGPDDATDIIVNDLLPAGLQYISDIPSQGSYDYLTGNWNVGNIANGNYATLAITAQVLPVGGSELVQLAILLDGSNSISEDDWFVMLEGLADAIEDCFPIDGTVELTIIQFGDYDPVALAQVEISPIIVDDTNYLDIASDIMDIIKLGGATPTACAINLAADTLTASPNFDPSNRQIINLVTDGVPNCICDPGAYIGEWVGETPSAYAQGKASAETARTYLLNTLQMTSDQDEFDVEAVGPAPDITWLRDYIVWPGNYEWIGSSPPGPGWVRQVDDYTEFASTLCEKFATLFENIENCATIINSNPIDPNSTNDLDCVEITPQPQIG